MKRSLFFLIFLLAFFSCTKKRCKYENPIAEIYVLNWSPRPIPNKGVAYMYKKGTHFAELIDTVRFYALAKRDCRLNNFDLYIKLKATKLFERHPRCVG